MTLEQAIRELRARSRVVPQPPRLPTVEEVDAAEVFLRAKLHPDYRTFLLTGSDAVVGRLEPATLANPGAHTHLLEVVRSARESGVPGDLLPICEDNGDFYCMSKDGSIRYWSRNGATDETWPSLGNWIREVWINESA